METLLNLDWSILAWIQDTLCCAVLDVVMPLISMLGNGGAVWILFAIALIFTKKYRRCGIIILCGLAVGVLVGNVCLKNIIARPRPCWLDTGVQLLIKIPADFSFPSGHTLSSVIAATAATLYERRFAWFTIPLASLIAFSRLYLYVHFPSDVLGGVLLGVLIGYAAFYGGSKVMTYLASKRGSAEG